MTRFDTLTVLWREPEKGTRLRIGCLQRVPDRTFVFRFDGELDRARDLGFPGLVEFTSFSETYRSRYLFATFAQRIPSPRRPDFHDMISDWGVEHADDPMEILARSGGAQLTDRLELSEFRADDDDLVSPLEFRIAGMRHYAGSIDMLKVGQELSLEHETDNLHDECATLVLTLAHEKLGHVPRHYAPLMARHLDLGHELAVHAVRRLAVGDDERWVVSVVRGVR